MQSFDHLNTGFSDMRFYILGIGPIGSLVAHNLRTVLPRTHPVTLIHKNMRQAMALKELGGTITVENQGILRSSDGFDAEVFSPGSNFGTGLAHDPNSSTSSSPPPEDIRSDPIESLFITTKAHTTHDAITRLLPRLTSSSTIVLMQNGMGIYEDLVQRVFRNPNERPHFILGANTHGAWMKGFYHVVHAGVGDIEFGVAPDARGRDFEAALSDESVPKHDRTLQLDDITKPGDNTFERYRSLRHTVAVLGSLDGLRTTWKPIADVQLAMRRKLVVNAVVNPLTALMGCRNGELFKHDASRRIMQNICAEAEAVYQAQAEAEAQAWLESFGPDVDERNVPLGRFPTALNQEQLVREVLRVAQVTGGNISSMCSDVQKGRNTEVDFMNGYLVKLGEQYNIPTPTNNTLLNLVKMRSAIPLDQML
ncbi:ketopantoate reductase PanE/ApbA C terminal-domain-containing protein [Hygrophoropsis aurantiaca]|uniref:Ketopantoate reductase PanE/ApbA C terminal-domain-containing protein n=1 Tax=Hygrophoropsis aurantiaca TaxID=72124 RepID=A0ACB8AUB5_9AGAM|nr:ketopantoate reductase PanE/ApbA C terminal-domain-containing protein [Hygrophoropsis aurantiaca]